MSEPKRGVVVRALALVLVASACRPADDGQSGARVAAPASTVGAAASVSAPIVAPSIRFDDITSGSGVDFEHYAGFTEEKWMPEIQSGGVGLVDVNRDGAPDLVFTTGRQLDRPRSGEERNRLYLNDGAGGFVEATEAWGLPTPDEGYGNGVGAGDFDGDGWTDLYITSYGGGEMLLRNTGAGFVDVTAEAGIDQDGKWGTSVGFLDLENDGHLDLLVQRFTDYRIESATRCHRNGVHVHCTPDVYDPLPQRVWRNRGDNTFEDVSETSGIASAPAYGLAIAIVDIDMDGDIDVYSANDISRNQLWLNDGSGVFEDVGRLSGSAYSIEGGPQASMGADVADVDRNGLLDLVVPNFQDETTSLYLQREPLRFAESSDARGIGLSARQRLSWGVQLFDADNDGDEDLFVANGHIWDNVAAYATGVFFAQPNSLYRNDGEGTFADISDDAGSALSGTHLSRGVATGDIDGDGRLDLVIVNNDAAPIIARNASPQAGHWVSLWLEGRTANRSAIGARVEATAGGRDMVRNVMGARSYLSAPDLRVHFGLGDATTVERLVIHWPGGPEQVIQGLAADAFYHVIQGEVPARYTPGAAVIPPSP